MKTVTCPNSGRTWKETSSGIKMPYHKMIPFGKLKKASFQRTIKPVQSEKIGKSVQDMGVIRPFYIFEKSKCGSYYQYDAHHLWEYLKTQIADDEEVLCVVVPWVDPDDDIEKSKYVLTINKDQASWTLVDFVEQYSNPRFADVFGLDYKYLFEQYKEFKRSGFTIGTIVAALTGKSRTNQDDPLKTGHLRIPSEDKQLARRLLEGFRDIKLQLKSKLTNEQLRELLPMFRKTAKSMNDLVEFDRIFKLMLRDIQVMAEQDSLQSSRSALARQYDQIFNYHFDTSKS